MFINEKSLYEFCWSNDRCHNRASRSVRLRLIGLALLAILISQPSITSAQTSTEAVKLINTANRQVEAGKTEEAISLYKKAIALEPRNALVYFNLGTAYSMGKQDYKQGRVCFQKAVEINPQFAKAWHNLGLALRNLNDLNGSEQALKKAVLLEPHECSNLCDLAYLYIKLGHYQTARELLIKASKLPESKSAEFEDLQQSLNYLNKKLSNKNKSGGKV